MIYSYIKADGSVKPIESEKPLPLERLQELVGGYIEFTSLEPGVEICMNEEGRINGSPRNARYPIIFGDVLVGRRMIINDEVEFVGIL